MARSTFHRDGATTAATYPIVEHHNGATVPEDEEVLAIWGNVQALQASFAVSLDLGRFLDTSLL